MPDDLAATFFHRSPVTSALLVAAADIYIHLRRQQRAWPPLGPLRDRLGWLVCGYSPRIASWLGPAARTLPASSVAIVGVRLKDWYGYRDSTLGHVLRHATSPIDPMAPRLQAALAAAAAEPHAAAAEAAAAAAESDADGGCAAAATPTASVGSAPAPPRLRSRPLPATRKARGTVPWRSTPSRRISPPTRTSSGPAPATGLLSIAWRRPSPCALSG